MKFPILTTPQEPTITVPTLKKQCIIFDLDGCLADVPIGTTRMDWANIEFCTEKMRSHPPDWRLIAMMNLFYRHHKDLAVLVMTGRPERYRAVTMEWLETYKALHHDLWMREDNDVQHDARVKQAMLAKLRPAMDVWFVVEDRDTVVEMWRKEGILCLQPRRGDF